MQITLNRSRLKAAVGIKAKRKELGKQVAFILGMPDAVKAMLGTANLGNVEMINKALQTGPVSEERLKGLIANKYNVAADTPALSGYQTAFTQFIHQNMPELDMGYEALFDHVDMTGSGQDYFEILAANMTAAWNARAPGEKTKLRKAIQDEELSVKMVEFSDGIELLDVWLDYSKFYRIEQAISEFINGYYEAKAKFHYGIFTSLTGLNFDVSSYADNVAALNGAAASIHRKMRGKGLPGGENAGLTVLVAPEHKGKVNKMFTATTDSETVAHGKVVEPLTARINNVISTTFVDKDVNGYWLVRAGGRIKKADWKALTIDTARDIEVSGEKFVGVGQYNCAIGDTDQVLFVPFK
mgnify:CR=1 FL=1